MRQHDDVGASLSQRRHLQRQDVEAEKQVGPEAAGGRQRGEVGIGCRNHSHVRGLSRPATDGPEFLALKKPQQHHLPSSAERLDLVQKHGAAARLRNEAGLGFPGICKRASRMTEQLAFEERLRKRATIDRNERQIAPGVEVMDGTGRELLPGSRFTADQNGRGRPRILANEIDRRQKRRRCSHEIQAS